MARAFATGTHMSPQTVVAGPFFDFAAGGTIERVADLSRHYLRIHTGGRGGFR